MHASIALGVTAASITDTSGLVSILGGLIALIITIAGGVGTWAALRVGRNSQLIANYKATAESWESRASGLKAENEGLADDLTDARKEVTDLKAKVTTLQELATGQPAVQQISNEMREGFDRLTKSLNGFGDSIESMKGVINGGSTSDK
jgi:uncharacterized protein YlxW (UPF0749 family)